MAKNNKVTRKRVVKIEATGMAFVKASFNNVIVSLTNNEGNTPYAAQMAAEECAKTAYDLGLRKVKVYVKGPGAGRESAIRAIHSMGVEVTEIIDVTPLPHNGCRPPKRRRV